ncbi:1,3-beta-glucanosyltransferase gas1 [Tulasnella sp. 417]|nr:1,3-beta-glucanosyltransferase gas1 [Tulasnella sp. 417]
MVSLGPLYNLPNARVHRHLRKEIPLPPTSDALKAFTILPCTPVADRCECLEKRAISCVFSNTSSNNTAAIIEELMKFACSQTAWFGGCAWLAGYGAQGAYGPFSGCSPTTKLSYVLSQYYQVSGRQDAACNFSGNATVIPTGPTDIDALWDAGDSCVIDFPLRLQVPADPTPSFPSTKGVSNPGATQTGGSKDNATKNNGTPGFVDARGAFIAIFASVIGFAGGMFVLL